MWTPQYNFQGPPPEYLQRFLGRMVSTFNDINHLDSSLFDIITVAEREEPFYPYTLRQLPRPYWPTTTYPITENTVWYFFFCLMNNYLESRQPPQFYTFPTRPFPLTIGYAHSNQTWRHRNRIDFLLYHSRWIHELVRTSNWSTLLRQRRQRTTFRTEPISAAEMFEFVDSHSDIMPYNSTISSRRDQYENIIRDLIPYYRHTVVGNQHTRFTAIHRYRERQQEILSFYSEPELSHMLRVMRTINRWRLPDVIYWRHANEFNVGSNRVGFFNQAIDIPIAQVNLLRLHDRAYSSPGRAPHPRSMYPRVNDMIQSGLWIGTTADIFAHPVHRHTDYWPGLHLPEINAFQRYGRPFHEGHFFSVNEYFGAYNEETGEDILSDVGDTFDNADPLDQAGNQW